MVENFMYEIGCILAEYEELEKIETLGHGVYEVTLLLDQYKNSLE
ncbi:hypothetical protein ACJ2A9_15090 [Anaerobacillus sp. MEB173]